LLDSLPVGWKRVNGQPPLTEAGRKLRSFYPSPEERKVYYAARKIPLCDRVNTSVQTSGRRRPSSLTTKQKNLGRWMFRHHPPIITGKWWKRSRSTAV
jgi:hypothetical protein